MGAITFSGVVASSNVILNGFTSMLTGYVGVIVLAVLLPFAASLILDGIVHVFRGRGLKPLMIAVALTVAVVVGGTFAISYGQPAAGPTPETAAGMQSVASMLLPFSVGLALLAFAFRMIAMLLKGNSSRSARA